MNDEQIKELINHSTRAAILLGEITGRLIMIVDNCSIGGERVMLSDIEDLLSMMQDRIEDIYYKQKVVNNE